MALRNEKGKLRPQPPRLKDVRARKRSEGRSRNQDSKGRFVKGNDAPKARTVNALIRRHLGRDATGETVETLAKETLQLFKLCKAAIGSDAPQVQDTLARRARWSVLSAHYALRAAEIGLETPEGQKCLELAIKLDQRAERLDVTALDLADRLQDPEPAGNPILEAIEARAAEYAEADARRDAEAAAEKDPNDQQT